MAAGAPVLPGDAGSTLPAVPESVRLHSPDGTPLAAALFDAGPGSAAVVVVPGFGSVKENHADFARAVGAHGITALCVDVRGQGGSGGTLDAGALDDVLTAVGWLRMRGHRRLGLRGSSMGGFLALHAAARDGDVRAVVAICPARPHSLALRTPTPWPRDMPLEPAVAVPGVARGFWHARGDERVPWGATWALAQRAPHPKHLRIRMGGTHGSLQHDPGVLADTAAFMAAHLHGA